MGLLDILNGMQNGPRGPSDPQAKGEGMSPVTMAILPCRGVLRFMMRPFRVVGE